MFSILLTLRLRIFRVRSDVDFRGTPEIGGSPTRELLQILRGLEGLNVVGADIVEVAPVYDTQAELTGLAAAGVVEALIELMVKTAVGHLEQR